MKRNKLELTWVGKDDRPRIEPRVLVEDPSLSYRAERSAIDDDPFDNRLIFGDNLLALKALEQEFAGKVKCVFIDPPYNTGSAFQHYDDGVEHSLWLSMMRERLEMLRRLLSDDGSIWITIDDNEAHYLKVMLDEIFGRAHFVGNVLWQKVYSDRMDARELSVSHDHILVYKRSERFKVRRLRVDQRDDQFNFVDGISGRHYRRRSLRKEGSSSLRRDRPNLWYPLEAPDGSIVYPVKPSGVEGNWRWWGVQNRHRVPVELAGSVDAVNVAVQSDRSRDETIRAVIGGWTRVRHSTIGYTLRSRLMKDAIFHQCDRVGDDDSHGRGTSRDRERKRRAVNRSKHVRPASGGDGNDAVLAGAA